MKTAIQTALSAALVATAILGGASAAFAGGSYYEGVSPTPLFTERTPAVTGKSSFTIGSSEAGYVDRNSTGSIVNYGVAPKPVQGGEGEYYQGLSR
ncbi:MAG TPA: hypothetical protein VGO04_03105 [Ensifer sp.]|jgi:hypothetical protein|uniref:hypothetical protein n=1 Tax=Ensifer sp. TaxID=1872086 RepID=UPI002E10E6B7|nr:hypothetical protein [Ensifer sp.]